MATAKRGQTFQDWFTQQWAILRGRKIDNVTERWLAGPYGQTGGIADRFIYKLAEDEGLKVVRNTQLRGLIPDFSKLNLSANGIKQVSQLVIDFYQNTAAYDLKLHVKWNPAFKLFGSLTNVLFSGRIKQLNIPLKNADSADDVNSEIITLTEPATGNVKYTIWYRTLVATGEVVYSGVYSTCQLPSGQVCVKAVFPLPNGNATVILSPTALPGGALRLLSSGKAFGDPGFYFLLNDAKGHHWAQYIRSFRDELIVYPEGDKVRAQQTLTLWNMRVVQFNYAIERKKMQA